MMKKRLLLSILVTSMFFTSALSLSSCTKSDNKVDSIPTVVTVVPIDREDPPYYFECPYCHELVLPNDPGLEKHTHWFGFGPTSPDPYYDTDDCLSAYVGPFCPYAAEGRKHRHLITYELHGANGGVHNTWHIGGGGGSGN